MEASRWILEKGDFECAKTAEIKDSELQGNVAVGDYVTVKDSVIRGPTVIGSRATVLKSKMYSSVVFPRASLNEVTLLNSIIQQNAVVKREEIADSIR